MVTDRREVEYQFLAPALAPVEDWVRANAARFGFELEATGNRRLEDTYLDTTSWQIFRAGYKLRSRKAGGRSELTFKSLGPMTSGTARSRREVSQVVLRQDLDPLKTAKGLVADWLSSLAGRGRPMPLFGVNTLRTTYLLKRQQRPIAEIALDDCQIDRAERTDPARVHFVEVEGDALSLPEVRRFITAMTRECGLTSAQVSKFGLGLSLNRLRPSGLPVFDRAESAPPTSVGTLALNIVRTEFLTFLQHEAGARLGEDAEDLHQMRVACRKLRAALRLFGGCLPRTLVRSQSALQWVGTALGAVRDLDVKLQRLGEWRAESPGASEREFERIVRWATRERARARRRMIRVLDSRRYMRLVQRLEASLRQGGSRRVGGGPRALEGLPELIRPLHKRVLRAGRLVELEPIPEHYHRLRIRCRRLRYALDFAATVRGNALDAYRKRLVRLQDVLGEYNDTVVARSNIRSWVQERTRSLPPRVVFSLGCLEERLRMQGESWLEKYPERFRAFEKRSWRSLEKLLQGGLPAR
jgi:CHAD domain-containing protein